MSQGDNLIRQYEQLKRALAAVENGLPERLGVAVYSDEPGDVEEAVRRRLEPFGLDSIDDAAAANCEVIIVKLPFCRGRGVGITYTDDPRISESMRAQLNSNKEATRTVGRLPIIGSQADLERGEE